MAFPVREAPRAATGAKDGRGHRPLPPWPGAVAGILPRYGPVRFRPCLLRSRPFGSVPVRVRSGGKRRSRPQAPPTLAWGRGRDPPQIRACPLPSVPSPFPSVWVRSRPCPFRGQTTVAATGPSHLGLWPWQGSSPDTGLSASVRAFSVPVRLGPFPSVSVPGAKDGRGRGSLVAGPRTMARCAVRARQSWLLPRQAEPGRGPCCSRRRGRRGGRRSAVRACCRRRDPPAAANHPLRRQPCR